MMVSDANVTGFVTKFIQRSIFAIPVLALALGATGTVNAQSEEEESSSQLEEVIITGTRKAGISPLETLSPVDLIAGTEIAKQAAFDMTDALTKLSPALGTQRFPIADGTAFVRPVTLRNLAPDQTLVLVNGTRRHRSALVNLQLAPLGTVNQGSQPVDFSAFPSAAIKRVEILRDGASAQYGADAIAGVINVILKDASEGYSVSAQYGEYYDGDGERNRIDANAGFPLGDNGFLNISAEYVTSDITSRGNARPDAVDVAAIVGANVVPYNGLGQRWGDPDVEATKLFLNAAFELNDSVELFTNISYMDKDTVGGFFYRGPVLDPIHMITARDTLQVDADVDFLPDPAPQSLVDSIIAAGLNPSDYITADAGSPSGFVLLNPIHTMFPGGYSPLFGAEISDYAWVAGARGETSNNLSWDFRVRSAENEVKYLLQDSINPSLGALSPTTFNPGTLTQEESGVNLDFVKTFDDSPLNVGFGFEFRNETYKIGAGDEASRILGPTFKQFGFGSDGFQGFGLETAGKWEKNSRAGYIDVETDLTDRFSGAIAVRYEDHDDFGDTTDYKVSGRYQVNDDLAIRGTVNTGFRVPTPGQGNTLNLTTSADEDGNLIPSGFYPVSHPVAVALGSRPQQTESSDSFSIGLVWQASDATTITLDYYDISIDDRIGALNKTVDQDAVDQLNAVGFPNADLLLGSAASFFSNAFDSDISGVDLIISTSFELSSGTLDVDFNHNYNDQDVSNIKPNTINASRAFDLENQIPSSRSVLTLNYSTGIFAGMLRFNRYDDWTTTGGVFSPGDASDATTYSGDVLVDVEARFQLGDIFNVAVGGENVFDTVPDDETNGTFRFLGVEDSITSPYGFNGGFWYLRISADF